MSIRRAQLAKQAHNKRRSVVIDNTYSQAVITQNKNKRHLNINLNASPIILSKRRNSQKRGSAPIILQSSTTPSAAIMTANIDCIMSASISSSQSRASQSQRAKQSPMKYTTPYNTPIGFPSAMDDNAPINEMIRESRKTLRSQSFRSRPRRYSKTRRLSTKLYDLMETVSTDERSTKKNCDLKYECFDDAILEQSMIGVEEQKARRAKHDYHETLKKYGYIEIRKIAKSLQGIVIEAEYIDKTSRGWDSVIIKITDKQLHFAKISNKHGKALSVQEDIMKEKRLLMYLTANNPPSSLVEFLGFFSDEYNYFLVMENGGEDFFDWIVKCHEWIREGKVSMKQWNLYIRDLMVQVLELLHWLHRKMNVCHLDISLENMLIKNNKYKSDGNGGIRLSRKMQVKFCDFGLAEFFNESETAKNRFLCNKYVGKTHYKAPKVYGKKEKFDARKADIWSLGVSFFMIMIGAPPYKLPLNSDEHYPYIQKRNVMGILKRWGREHYINKNVEQLMNMMMEIDEDKRANIDDLIKHAWFQNAVIVNHNDKGKSNHKNGKSNNKNNKQKSGSGGNKKQKRGSKKMSGRMLVKLSENTKLNQNNVFQHLVTEADQQRLFRYKKRRLTNTL